jgi:hypothetical protein
MVILQRIALSNTSSVEGPEAVVHTNHFTDTQAEVTDIVSVVVTISGRRSTAARNSALGRV